MWSQDTKAASNAKQVSPLSAYASSQASGRADEGVWWSQGYTNSLLDDHILTFRNSFLKPLVAESMAKRRQDNDSTMQF